MRIGLDARYAGDHFPGIGRYISGLARGLAELERGHTLVLIRGPAEGRYGIGGLAALPGVEPALARSGPFSLSQQVELPHLARALRLDLLHSPFFVKPLIGLPCPSLVTIYDMLGRRYPRTLSWRGRLLYRLAMRLAVASADGLIAISESARAELCAAYRLPPGRVAVTPLAADNRFRPQPAAAVAALRERLNLPEPYLLYLGSNKPHKNLARLVRAWQRLLDTGAAAGITLLLAGHQDRQHPELRQLVAAPALAGRVRLVAAVPDADLPALYSGALAFVFPSYYEGFGLPPLEAMACGVPVLCANTSSLPEVAGEAALTVDPFSVAALADGLARLIHDDTLRHDLAARGLRRAGQFSWRHTATATMQVYLDTVDRFAAKE